MAVDLSTQKVLSFGSSVSDEISTFGETDSYKVDLLAGNNYTFSVGLGGLYDSTLTLYDASGTLVAFNDDANGLASVISFTPNLAGSYFLEVSAYGNNYVGAYELAAVESRPENVAPTLTGSSTTFASVQAGSSITLSEAQLLAGWTDANGDSLSVQNVNVSSGSIVNNNNGTWTFRAPNSGQATLTYEVSDGRSAATAQNTIATVATPTPTITVTKLNAGTTEDGGTAQISVALNAPITQGSFTVTLTASDVTEALFSNGTTTQTITFDANNWSAPQMVTLVGVQDYENDGNVAYNVNVRGTNSVLDPVAAYRTAIHDLNVNLTMQNGGDVTADGLDRDVPVYLIGDDGRPQMDRLVGNDGHDRLYGGYMVDELNGGLGNDRLYGGYEDDFLYGGDGDDRLYGEQDDDYLNGGAGNDRMDGGIGADVMVGGAGNDTYYVTLGDDGRVEDLVNESAAVGGSGTDTIYIPFEVEAYVAPEGVEVIRMNAGFGGTTLTGNRSNNGLYGNAGDNVLDGGTGNDTLSGGTGADSLVGGVGNDTLQGGIGDDVLTGGAGRDVLVGGAGEDTFDFNLATEAGTSQSTASVIQDFTTGTDQVDLSGIDANTAVAGNQLFTQMLFGSTAFTRAGQLRWDTAADILYGNTDADAAAEFMIRMTGVNTLSLANDIIA